MSEEIFELVDEEMFSSVSEAVPIVWWLVHLAGGKVAFPVEEEFWIDNCPQDTRLVLRKENNQLVLVAEAQNWGQSSAVPTDVV
jgi:hypothetical protein